MTVWDEFFARYRDLPVWSPEVTDDYQLEAQRTAMEERLVADFTPHYALSSQEDITWFRNALEHEQQKFFVAFVLKEPHTDPESLYESMMRAAVYERNPSK